MKSYVDIVFDGPPAHESGRFVEVEDSSGKSIKFGEWIKRDDFWVLRIPDNRDRIRELEQQLAASQEAEEVSSHMYAELRHDIEKALGAASSEATRAAELEQRLRWQPIATAPKVYR